jgi:hypothetical protein
MINIEIVKSSENNLYIFTKNFSQEIHDKLVTKFLGLHAEEYKD